MNNFKDFGIKREQAKGFIGNKIKTDRILNIEITVHRCEINDSTKEIGTKRLDMQISIGETMHVIFTSGKALIEDMQNNPQIKYPFKTTIVKENDWLKFT